MMNPLRHKAILFTLAVPLAVGGALIAYEYEYAVGQLTMAEAMVPVPPAQVAEREAFRLPPLVSFQNITTRPLFTATRRPAPATSQTVDKAATSRPSLFQLTGVIIASEARLAFIRDQRGGAQYPVRIGARVGGWTVEEIHPDRVIVVRAGERAEIGIEAATRGASRQPARNRRR